MMLHFLGRGIIFEGDETKTSTLPSSLVSHDLNLSNHTKRGKILVKLIVCDTRMNTSYKHLSSLEYWGHFISWNCFFNIYSLFLQHVFWVSKSIFDTWIIYKCYKRKASRSFSQFLFHNTNMFNITKLFKVTLKNFWWKNQYQFNSVWVGF